MNVHKRKSSESIRLGIVVSDYYTSISEGLLSGAFDVLNQHNGVQSETVRVSGAWEIPLIVKIMAESGQFHGIIALGCVIRGETAHFDYICEQCSFALMNVGLDYGIPVGFGILTADTKDQAVYRSRRNQPNNKGAEAAEAVMSSVDVIAKLRQGLCFQKEHCSQI